MTPNPTDRMRDPYYAGLLIQIEQIICQADDEATSAGIRLTDSQIKSALNKTQKVLAGSSPNLPGGNPKDELLAKLIHSLCMAREALREQVRNETGQELSLDDWRQAIETIEDSVKTRKSDIPGSRDYLDYVHEFVAEVKELSKKHANP